MNNPLVSIIIPVYNTEKYLRKCLDSVVAQTYGNWECICVNDGSPDGSASILEEYSAKDSRIKIVNRENGGLSAARNTGMGHIQGEWFIFVDSDDFIHPQLLEVCVYQALRDSSDIVVYRWPRSYTRWVKRLASIGIHNYKPRFSKIVKEKARSLKTDDIYKYATVSGRNTLHDVDKKFIIRDCSVCKAMFSFEKFGDIRFYEGIMFEDVPWWGHALLKAGTATINNLNLYYYYPNLGSFTRDKAKLDKRIANMEKMIPLAEKIYENAGTEYQKKIWNERFMASAKRKLEKLKLEAQK